MVIIVAVPKPPSGAVKICGTSSMSMLVKFMRREVVSGLVRRVQIPCKMCCMVYFTSDCFFFPFCVSFARTLRAVVVIDVVGPRLPLSALFPIRSNTPPSLPPCRPEGPLLFPPPSFLVALQKLQPQSCASISRAGSLQAR